MVSTARLGHEFGRLARRFVRVSHRDRQPHRFEHRNIFARIADVGDAREDVPVFEAVGLPMRWLTRTNRRARRPNS